MFKERPSPTEDEVKILQASEVPTISLKDYYADCAKDCDDPCSSDNSGDGYLNGFDESGSIFHKLELDYDSNLLGSIKTNGRTVVVATGKSDWPHSVTDEPDLYAHIISKAYQAHLEALPPLSIASSSSSSSGSPSPELQTPKKRRCVDKIPGLGDGLNEQGTERLQNLTILCGSQRKYECEDDPLDDEPESVMVFPDYKLVANLPKDEASQLIERHLSPRILGPASPLKGSANGHSNGSSSPTLQSFVLPYYAVILVCSHKRRDKRCHITADPLIDALRDAIEGIGHRWSVDTRGDDAHAYSPYAINGSTDVLKTLKVLSDPNSSDDKQVGIFKTSHIGGHKFSGQLVIYLPNGTSVWYARVREIDCKMIVEETLLKGRIVRDLLRGGTGLAGRKSVLEW